MTTATMSGPGRPLACRALLRPRLALAHTLGGLSHLGLTGQQIGHRPVENVGDAMQLVDLDAVVAPLKRREVTDRQCRPAGELGLGKPTLLACLGHALANQPQEDGYIIDGVMRHEDAL
jgi:hypothetical protein